MNGIIKSNRFRCLVPVTAVVLLVALVITGVLLPWWNKNLDYQKDAEDAADRIGRYQRLIQQQPVFREALAQLRTEHKKQGYFLAGSSEELAAAELQKRVKDVVGEAGGTLVSTQNIPATIRDLPGKVQIRVRLKGDTDALTKVLYELERQHPLLFVENLNIKSRRSVRGRRQNRVTTYTLDVSFNLAGYMQGGVK